ncbi:MAG: CHRD domain-containing protein [Chloroflexota bacterium]
MLAFSLPVQGATPSSVLLVTMNGQEVLPRGADPNGFANIKISLYVNQFKACYTLSVGNMAYMSHLEIHQAVKGQNGPEVLGMEAGGYRTTWTSCNTG